MSSPFYGAASYLEHVDTLGDPNANYDFYDLLIIKDTRDGKFWVATDSGCSCPTPFENHKFPTDFTELRTANDLDEMVKDGPWTAQDIEAAKSKVWGKT